MPRRIPKLPPISLTQNESDVLNKLFEIVSSRFSKHQLHGRSVPVGPNRLLITFDRNHSPATFLNGFSRTFFRLPERWCMVVLSEYHLPVRVKLKGNRRRIGDKQVFSITKAEVSFVSPPTI